MCGQTIQNHHQRTAQLLPQLLDELHHMPGADVIVPDIEASIEALTVWRHGDRAQDREAS